MRTVSVYDQGADRVIELRGELDVQQVDQLREALAEAVEHRPSRLLIDLAALSFIDSMGLGVIISGYRAAVRAGIDVYLARPSPFVHRLLQAMGMMGLFKIVDTLA